MCSGQMLRDMDVTNPYSGIRMAFDGEDYDDDYYRDPNDGVIYHRTAAARHKYLDDKAAVQAAEKKRADRAAKAAYSTQFDAISEAARGMRQRYAQTLGYNPYFIR